MLTLYSYYRSSAAYRVRLALGLKGLPFDIVPVHLARDGGEHKKPAYRAVNPQGRVPALKIEDGTVLMQSPAILEYLEETVPEPPLLPKDASERARVRAVMAMICCDIHPIINSGTLAKLRSSFAADDDAINAWIAHWVTTTLATVEEVIRPEPYCFGATPGLADVCLVPQLFSARRFSVPLTAFPKILAVDQAMAELPATKAAHPTAQPDTE